MNHTHYYQVQAQTHFELGYKVAQLLKVPLSEKYQTIIKNASRDKKIISESKQCLQLVNNIFPQYVEELKGTAEGLGIQFEMFWLATIFEALDSSNERCTSCFSSDGMIIGHNEDEELRLEERISILEKTIDNITIFELYYANSLGGDACGINSHGYIQTINTSHHIDKQIGITRNIIARWLSETQDPKQDFEEMKKMTRSMGYSHTIGNLQGKVINIESTAKTQRLGEPSLPFIHTNHYLTDLSIYEDSSNPGNSIDRYIHANKLIGSVQTVEDMMNLLESVTNLPSNKERACKTLARMVFDLREKAVWCWLKRESDKGWIKYPIRFL